jgi:UDP-3-O-[3-hydroxymyristoyl] glucosamine N-acyltransferase
MADPRFYSCAGPFTLAELATLIEAEVGENSDADLRLVDVAPLDRAGTEHLSFLDNRKYIAAFESSSAAACIVHPGLAARAPKGMALLLSTNPYKAYALAARAFYPVPTLKPYVAETAFIDGGARVDPSCCIKHGAVIGANATIGRNCLIEANAVIGPSVEIGNDVIIGACASLSHCLIGDRTRIYPGARIGQDGFGFAPDPDGHTKVPQLGRVIIGEDVEIGANSTVDRGSGPDTIIGQGCWIDNLVQIGHNVELGRGCVLAGMVGISGSTKVGDFVFFGGQAGAVGHISIGAGAKVAGKSGVIRSIPPGATVGGTPAVPIRDWHRQSIILSKLIDRDE